jgi:signal transduction histidine kinase
MRTKKAILNVALLLIIPLPVSGQHRTAYADSMLTALRTATSDTVRLELNRALGFYYQDGSADVAMDYHMAQLELAQKLNFKLWEADAYQQLGYCYRRLDNLPISYEYYNKAFDLAGDPSSVDNDWKYQKFSDSKSPADARLSIIGMTHFEISNLYRRSRSYDEEKYHLAEAMKIGEKLQSSKILGLTARDIGSMYFAENQPDSAFKYYQIALQHYKNSPYQINLSIIYRLISDYYIREGKVDSALVYSKKAVALGLKDNAAGSLSNTQLFLGNLFKEVGQLDSARIYTERSIATAQSVQQWFTIGRGNTQLAEILELQGNETLAYDRLKYGIRILDSLNAEHILRLVAFQNLDFDQKVRVKELEKENEQSKSRFRIYSLLGGLGLFIIVALLLYRNNRHKQRANKVLELTLSDLKSTQTQLIQQEKLASLGQLTAGIAHEIKNPLNFVNNFSEVSLELIDEALEELSAVKAQCTASPGLPNASPGMESFKDIEEILADVQSNLTKIHQHGSRANGIVSSMLQHSRGGSGKPEPTDLNALVKEYVNLAFHGMRAGKNPFDVDIKLDFDEKLGKLNLIGEDFSRVVLNLTNNAFDAMREKVKIESSYTPKLTIRSKRLTNSVEIQIEDNGPGIPDEIKDKILQPFFTTKKGTEGTGLGLSITHDIIKAHGGEMRIESKVDHGTTFIVQIPITV